MKELQFFHFGLMPYPHIPPPEEIESTWVTLSNSHYDPVEGHRLYNEYLDQSVLAEKLGYDGTCVNEHHQKRVRHDARPQRHGLAHHREDAEDPGRDHRQRAPVARQPAAG